jgi:hypothetical protein
MFTGKVLVVGVGDDPPSGRAEFPEVAEYTTYNAPLKTSTSKELFDI